MSNLRYHLILQLTVFVWGYTGILGKLISLPKEHLVWMRILIALPAMCLIMMIARAGQRLSLKQTSAFFFTGIFIVAHWVFFYGSIKVSTASIAAVCLATQSVFMSILEPVFLRKQFVWYELGLGLIACLGIGLIFGIETEYTVGILMGLAASFFGAVFTLFNSRFVQHHSALAISSIEMLGGLFFLSVYLLCTNGFHENWFALSQNDWIYLVLLAIGCTAITFPVGVWVMKKVTPFTVSISLNLEPIYTILLALVIFGDTEHMSAGFYIGTVIILGTVVANAYIKLRSPSKIQT
ncbi:MAG: DMT family transporter [Flavobacteriales bacterium]